MGILTQDQVVQVAERLYETRFKRELESGHDGEFVAREPETGEYFLGKTLSAAIQAARRVHPTRLPYAMQVGSDPAGRAAQPKSIQR